MYPDLIYGKVQRLKRSPAAPQKASEDGDASIDSSADTILLKTNGTPTYHFANVVDDHLMRITHVIRGSEWAASTPLHYDIYSAFGWTPPQFAHVGLLVDQNQAKLSKRNQDLALDVASMRDQHGVLSGPLCNFLALLGWSNPLKNDVMSIYKLRENFDLKFTRGNTMVQMEKLWYLQKQHVAKQCYKASEKDSAEPVENIVSQIETEVNKHYQEPIVNAGLKRKISAISAFLPLDSLNIYCTHVLLADSKNYTNAHHFVDRNRYFFDFDLSRAPDEHEFYGKARKIPVQVLQEHAKSFAKTYRAWENGLAPETSGTNDTVCDDSLSKDDTQEQRMILNKIEEMLKRPRIPQSPRAIDHLETRLHNELLIQTWLMVLGAGQSCKAGNFSSVCYPPEPLPAPLTPRFAEDAVWELMNKSFTAEETIRVPRCRRGSTSEQSPVSEASVLTPAVRYPRPNGADFARKIAANAWGSQVSEAEIVGLERRYKEFQGAFMKFLREKLALGLPGPSVSVIMAILGEEECVRRLGVTCDRDAC